MAQLAIQRIPQHYTKSTTLVCPPLTLSHRRSCAPVARPTHECFCCCFTSLAGLTMDYVVFDAAVKLFLQRADSAGCAIVPNDDAAVVSCAQRDFALHKQLCMLVNANAPFAGNRRVAGPPRSHQGSAIATECQYFASKRAVSSKREYVATVSCKTMNRSTFSGSLLHHCQVSNVY